MKYFTIILAIVFLLMGCEKKISADLIINNASILDLDNNTVLADRSLAVMDGRIVAIRKGPLHCQVENCQELDAQGGYLMPGLADMHQHLGIGSLTERPNPKTRLLYLQRLQNWGITTVFDPNQDKESVLLIQKKIADHPEEYPEFFTTGPSIGRKGGWAYPGVSTVEEAKSAVQANVALGVDAIKIVHDDMAWIGSRVMPSLDREMISAVIQDAHAAGLKVYVHAPKLALAKEALALGADGLIHGIIDEPVDKEFLGLMKKNQAIYIPTLSLYEACADITAATKRQLEFDPHLLNGAAIYEELMDEDTAKTWAGYWDRIDFVRDHKEVLKNNLVTIYQAGIPVTVGTDASVPGVVLGASLHQELALYVEAGISEAETLLMATRGAAKMFGREAEEGDVREGKIANLLILTENPLEGIEALKTLEYVIRLGRVQRIGGH